MSNTNEWTKGANFQTEQSATVDTEFIIFQSGTRVPLRHVTSVSPVDMNSGQTLMAWVLMIFGLCLLPLLALGALALFPIGFIGFGIYLLMNAKIYGVAVTSSSGERWFIAKGAQEEAARYSRELQDRIFSTHVGLSETPKVKLNASVSITDELATLVKMKESGAISDEEFLLLKSDIMKRAKAS